MTAQPASAAMASPAKATRLASRAPSQSVLWCSSQTGLLQMTSGPSADAIRLARVEEAEELTRSSGGVSTSMKTRSAVQTQPSATPAWARQPEPPSPAPWRR